MEPQARSRIEDIAAEDPVAALAMALGVRRAPYSVTLAGSFSTFTLNQLPIEANQKSPFSQRTWIDNVAYSIDLPNVFKGQVFKSLSDAMMRFSTGVAVRLWIYEGPSKYVLSNDFTPIESLLNNMLQRWQAGWLLERQAAMLAEMIITDAPYASDTNLGPMNVSITFNGWQFLDPYIDEVSSRDARKILIDGGYCIKDIHSCAEKQGYKPAQGLMRALQR